MLREMLTKIFHNQRQDLSKNIDTLITRLEYISVLLKNDDVSEYEKELIHNSIGMFDKFSSNLRLYSWLRNYGK